jgi:hypothetical protein
MNPVVPNLPLKILPDPLNPPFLALRASGNGLTLNHLSSLLVGEETGGGYFTPTALYHRNRVPASPLKWGGEQGETLSHQLLPCGLAFNSASLTGVGQRAHLLALSAKRCSLFFAPALALWTRFQFCESYGRRSTGSPARPQC